MSEEQPGRTTTGGASPAANGSASAGLSYRDAGVDRQAAERAKDRIARLVRSTVTEGVLSETGAFGGLFQVPAGMDAPVLVSSADGVGTKLKVAMRAGRHHSVGHDLVNHCVNDILVEGAHPLFFLDYIGMGALEEGVVEALVAGIADGCRENGCALLGGETAEMPDFYAPGEYDLAGFIVGVVEREGRPGADRVRAGDVLLGLRSDGFHTNGYSLLRRLFFDRLGLSVEDPYPYAAAGLQQDVADTVGEVLLRVHRSYLRPLLPLLGAGRIHALAHITGGGIPGNLARVLPENLRARVDADGWEVPPEFLAVERLGNVDREEMLHTFNMGVGMVVVAAGSEAAGVQAELTRAGETVWTIGRVEEGSRDVLVA